MAGDDWHLGIGQFAINDMKIRPADAAGRHSYPDLARPGLPIGKFCPFEGCPELL
jgi:hypothetical protein